MIMSELLNLPNVSFDPTNFIEKGGLSAALSEIGGNELDAAIECVKEAYSSYSSRETINRALGHLESADRHFYGLLKRRISLRYAWNVTTGSLRGFWTCCLAALCHQYLVNSSTTTKKYLIWANFYAYSYYINLYYEGEPYRYPSIMPFVSDSRYISLYSGGNDALTGAMSGLTTITNMEFLEKTPLPMKPEDFRSFCYSRDVY